MQLTGVAEGFTELQAIRLMAEKLLGIGCKFRRVYLAPSSLGASESHFDVTNLSLFLSVYQVRTFFEVQNIRRGDRRMEDKIEGIIDEMEDLRLAVSGTRTRNPEASFRSLMDPKTPLELRLYKEVKILVGRL